MVGKRGPGEEGQREVEDVHGLHGPQQSLPEGLLSSTKHCALVDSASGYRMLSFLDAFFGYNQIKMHPRDECKTSFMTELSCYCYIVMSFGLKNAGGTY